MKRILITSLFLAIVITANAQQKKTTTKKTVAANSTKEKISTKGINEQNYGIVIEYINNTINCLNKQQKEIVDREEYRKTWSDYFVDNQSNSKNRVIYSPYIAYDLSRNSVRCVKGNAPDIMESADVNFYNENYIVLVETFQKMALVWNEMASFSKPNIPTKEYGKNKCEELNALYDTYYQTREKLSARNKQLQKQLFPYSVANSPYKVAYNNLYNDLDSVREFVNLCIDAKDLNSASIKNTLVQLEGPVTEHYLYANDNKVPSNYKNFYEMATKYIVSSTKAKLNGKGLEKKDIEQLQKNYNSLISIYNNDSN